jgi:ABC-type antimicrobial peptide transport system permease subunit
MRPTAALTSVLPREARVARLTARPRVVTLLLSLFGSVALFLVAAGLYGTIAFTVARRTRELGLRASLGASHATLVASVLRQALAVTAIGVVSGLAGAAWSMRFLDTLVYGTEAVDPATLAGVCVALFAVACAAAYVPARQALRIDPVVALRSD